MCMCDLIPTLLHLLEMFVAVKSVLSIIVCTG